ncbi:hypothetical protein CEXT_578781 [Caerostris extrusa]|uniref:Uncharacterized protein n=1 Tax=Caerostris extrusa TaxID=172846 RepID=A0AAV4QZE4_CAEEX|nr:hypothetical protein CEXT_578781 [Caerostris extrusa]
MRNSPRGHTQSRRDFVEYLTPPLIMGGTLHIANCHREVRISAPNELMGSSDLWQTHRMVERDGNWARNSEVTHKSARFCGILDASSNNGRTLHVAICPREVRISAPNEPMGFSNLWQTQRMVEQDGIGLKTLFAFVEENG